MPASFAFRESFSEENLVVLLKRSIFAYRYSKESKLKQATKMDNSHVIDNIKMVAKATLPPKSSVLLYGSRARGDFHGSSDWDILILVDRPSLTFTDYNLAYPFRELGWKLNEEINPQVYSWREWKANSFTPFYKNVEHDKIVLL